MMYSKKLRKVLAKRLRLIIIKMKRNRTKKDRLNDYDAFESKRRRAKKRNRDNKGKQDFANQYEHEFYLDNYDR